MEDNVFVDAADVKQPPNTAVTNIKKDLQMTIAITTKTNLKTTKAKAVVLNDSSKAVDYNKQTLVLLNSLINQREKWETTVYRKSNEMLYGILRECYSINYGMLGNDKVAKARRAALEQFVEEKNYRFTESTPVVTKVLKCIFGVDRRRVSAYSIVLREAAKQNVMLKDLPQWIEDNDGVEQIRLGKAPNAKTPKQKAAAAKKVMAKAEVMGVAKGRALSKNAGVNFVGTDCVLLATQQADGSFAVRAVVRTVGAVNAALVAYLSQTKGVVLNDSKKREAANDSKMRDNAINKAIAQ